MKNIGTHGTLPVFLVEEGADYFFIGSPAYAQCGYGDVAYSGYDRFIQCDGWDVFFNANGSIGSLRNTRTSQWHGQSTGLQMMSLVTDYYINPAAILPAGTAPAAYYGFKIETVIEYITGKIPAFVPFFSQAQYERS